LVVCHYFPSFLSLVVHLLPSSFSPLQILFLEIDYGLLTDHTHNQTFSLFFSAAISLEKEIFVFNIDGKVPLTITQMNLFQRKKL